MKREISGGGSGQVPNILMFIVDDMGYWAMGCAGNKDIATPNLDALAAAGTRFENCFCASPVCSPARASLLTGRMPSQHGVLDWLRAGSTVAEHEPAGEGRLIEYLEGQVGYTDVLAGAGYECGISGKWHLGNSHSPQKGYTFWHVHAKGGGNYYNAPMIKDGELYLESEYVTDAITRHAINWLASRGESPAPFYLTVAYTAPHSPWDRDNHPKELYDEYYDNCAFDSIPRDETPPAWVEHLSIPVESARRRREVLSGYAAAITAMDAAVGRLLDWLDCAGMREDTLVLFVGDNGMSMGHHGVYGKGNATRPLNLFDTSVKVPFIASQPGRVAQGGVERALVSHYDFFPTLLEYAGLEAPRQSARLPGRSFLPLLTREGGSCAAEREVVVFDEYGSARMLRTDKWKLVERRGGKGPTELYDLENDPRERENLASHPEWREMLETLRGRLEAWFKLHSTARFDAWRAPVSGSGQMDMWDAENPGESVFAQPSGD